MTFNTVLSTFVKYWFPLFLWCALIFWLSGIPNLRTDLGFWDLVLRKCAHLTEYAVLYLLALRAFFNSRGRLAPKQVILLAAGFSVLYAAGDEFHQAFVPTRGPSAVDVGIDSAGVFIGYFLNKRFGFYGKKNEI